MDKNLVIHYSELIIEKLDDRTDAFMLSLEALKAYDQKQIEYIEQMLIRPLDIQLHYLITLLEKALGTTQNVRIYE